MLIQPKNWVSQLIATAFGITLFSSVMYGVMARTVADFLAYPISYAGYLYSILLGLIFGRWFYFGFPKTPLSEKIIAILAPLPVSVIICILYYTLGVSIKDFIDWFPSHADANELAVGVAALLTLTMGIVLFAVRLKWRCVYGLTEVVVGVFVAVRHVADKDILGNLWDSNIYLFVLTAGIYLVVRGLDNMHQGLTKEPFDFLSKKIIGLVLDGPWNSRLRDKVSILSPHRHSLVLRRMNRERRYRRKL